MSYTEIVKFTNSGRAKYIGETQNSHRGASLVWRTLETHYLPPYIPYWGIGREDLKPFTRQGDMIAMKDIWNLFSDSKVSRIHKIVLGSTFDKVIVFKKDIPELIAAYRAYDWETSLPEQADIIETFYKKDKNLIAIAWNQTSINSNHWLYDKSYNILKQTDHWDLFEDLKV